MRRLYILLAAALIASCMLALTVGSAGARNGTSKPYLAMTAAPSVVKSYGRAGPTLKMAKKLAMQMCENSSAWSASYANDCQGVVWVYHGAASIAWEKTKEQPYKYLQGAGSWGKTEAEAKYNALRGCQSVANEKCTVQNTKQVKYPSTGGVTGGVW
jgi:hypothetical protein